MTNKEKTIEIIKNTIALTAIFASILFLYIITEDL